MRIPDADPGDQNHADPCGCGCGCGCGSATLEEIHQLPCQQRRNVGHGTLQVPIHPKTGDHSDPDWLPCTGRPLATLLMAGWPAAVMDSKLLWQHIFQSVAMRAAVQLRSHWKNSCHRCSKSSQEALAAPYQGVSCILLAHGPGLEPLRCPETPLACPVLAPS